MTGERTGPDAVRRIPPLLRFVLAWAAGIPFAFAFRLLFDLDDPWPENLLTAAGFSLAMTPAVGGPHLWHRLSDDDRALRRAVRRGSPPDDDRLRAALPDHLAWLRRGAWSGLAAGLPLCAALMTVGWSHHEDRGWWVGTYALVALVLVVVAVRTLVRVRRLAPGQRG